MNFKLTLLSVLIVSSLVLSGCSSSVSAEGGSSSGSVGEFSGRSAADRFESYRTGETPTPAETPSSGSGSCEESNKDIIGLGYCEEGSNALIVITSFVFNPTTKICDHIAEKEICENGCITGEDGSGSCVGEAGETPPTTPTDSGDGETPPTNNGDNPVPNTNPPADSEEGELEVPANMCRDVLGYLWRWNGKPYTAYSCAVTEDKYDSIRITGKADDGSCLFDESTSMPVDCPSDIRCPSGVKSYSALCQS